MAIITKLKAIADAIRAKLGTTATMTMDEMATNIANISAGTTINNQDKTVTSNGTVTADTGYTGLGTVTVNVPTATTAAKTLGDIIQTPTALSDTDITALDGSVISNTSDNSGFFYKMLDIRDTQDTTQPLYCWECSNRGQTTGGDVDFVIYTKTETLAADTKLYYKSGSEYTGSSMKVVKSGSDYIIQLSANSTTYTLSRYSSGDTYLSYSSLYFCTEDEWQTAVTNDSECKKFVLTEGSGYFAWKLEYRGRYSEVNGNIVLPDYEDKGYIYFTSDINPSLSSAYTYDGTNYTQYTDLSDYEWTDENDTYSLSLGGYYKITRDYSKDDASSTPSAIRLPKVSSDIYLNQYVVTGSGEVPSIEKYIIQGGTTGL